MRLVEFLFRNVGFCVTCLEISSAKDDVALQESVLLEMCQMWQGVVWDMPMQIPKGCTLGLASYFFQFLESS